jgi:hypothetical protein
VRLEGLGKLEGGGKKSIHLVGSRTGDFLAWSIVSQPPRYLENNEQVFSALQARLAM